MLTLVTYPAGLGAFSLSPFCVKAALLLQTSGQLWQRRDSVDPRRTPHGKLPVLETSGGLVPDTSAIRTYLEHLGTDFDPGLSDDDRALSHGFSRMAEDHLYFHIVMDRWGDDAVWPTIRDLYFASIPRAMRAFVAGGLRRNLLRGLSVQGIERFTPQERFIRADADLKAIAARLRHRPFLFGNAPTAADFSVAPMLDALRRTPVATRLTKRVSQDETLTAYLDRIEVAVPLSAAPPIAVAA